jgi:hypothetical protein
LGWGLGVQGQWVSFRWYLAVNARALAGAGQDHGVVDTEDVPEILVAIKGLGLLLPASCVGSRGRAT